MTGRRAWLLCAAVPFAAAAYVFRGALHLYFAQEDFRGLAVAAGLLPRYDHLWRYVSVQAFMDVFYPLFGTHAARYHAVSLGLHALNAALLFALLARLLERPAALVGSMFFAVHPALFTAVYWQSARSDVLAVTFALATLLLVLGVGPARWLALATFALSILSKESTILLPVVAALLVWRRRDATTVSTPWRDPVTLTLFAEGALYFFYLVRSGGVGNSVGFDHRSAYGFDFTAALVGNLLTYVGWTVDLGMSAPGLRFMDRRTPRSTRPVRA